MLYACQRQGDGSASGTPSASATRPPASTGASPGERRTTAPQGRTSEPKGPATDPASGLRWVEPNDLPAEARRTIGLIEKGGPFPYDKDGTTFGNLEGVLPKKSRGYYKEYTVPTPGERDRGARRIVTGDNDREFYWTADHYVSFERIRR
ncbi:hypothetical protein HJ590_02950 [Naumannella sp. ID2617S]|uniref:Uncharacterized protein n=1 Tax=Enemella dayhoffiae TaxID=2016507 RepID=A0A255HCK3_9ACTN|nr:hypothetical protein [Naumannella sp. ID2617S]OYO24723.1 hypothetical protein CGZ93_02740 [Enemella dayhoffiae]